MIDIKKNIIEIKASGFTSEIERGNIKILSETADGINVEMLNGVQLLYSNYDMPQTTKRSIVQAFMAYKGVKRLIIDLHNLNCPVTMKNN